MDDVPVREAVRDELRVAPLTLRDQERVVVGDGLVERQGLLDAVLVQDGEDTKDADAIAVLVVAVAADIGKIRLVPAPQPLGNLPERADRQRRIGRHLPVPVLKVDDDGEGDAGVVRPSENRCVIIGDNVVMEKIRQLWLNAAPRPTECDPAFAALSKSGLWTEDLIWQRIRLAMAAGETRLAAHLGDGLSPTERPWVTLWIANHDDPAKALASEDFKYDHPMAREIIAHGIARLARTDAEQAYATWRRFAPRFKIYSPRSCRGDPSDGVSKGERCSSPLWSKLTSGDPLIGQIERSLGLAAADQRLPQAFAWLYSIDPSVVDAQVQRAQLRLAIATGAWPDLARWTEREAVGDMNPLRWRYWRARALESTGHAPAARGLFQELAAERDYYGFAAADRLGVPYRFGHRPTRLSTTEDARIRSWPGMVRARELWLAGYPREARSEWTYTVNHLPDRAVPAAAAIAHEWGWHDRVIFALGKVKAYDDLEFRFPIPYASWVSESAARFNIEPAILYSIMRAESAFFDQARSTAGAVGLMQVLPSTGRLVAKDLGMPLAADVKLYDPKTNIALGSRYLSQMLARFNGNLAMAAAAYNAGPGKVERWRPQGGCQNAEFWVETIPYTETRRYVRNTLFYTALYEWRMGKRVKPITERLAAVSPRGGTARCDHCAAANNQIFAGCPLPESLSFGNPDASARRNGGIQYG